MVGRKAQSFTYAILSCVIACSGELKVAEFTTDRAAVGLEETVELRWNVSGARTVYLLADPPDALGVYEVASAGRIQSLPLKHNTTFTLRAVDGLSVVEVVRPVEALPSLAIERFIADPSTVPAGRSATLQYRVQGALQVRILEGTTVLVSEQAPFSGRLEVTPAAAGSAYVLEATRDAQTVRAELTVATRAPGDVLAFSAAPLSFSSPSAPVTLSYRTANAASVQLLRDGDAVTDFAGKAEGEYVTRVTATTRFELVAGGARASLIVRALGQEEEPNDTRAQAGAIGNDALSGSIRAGDTDLFRVELGDTGYISAVLSACSQPLALAILRENESLVASAAGPGCASIEPAGTAAVRALPAGIYYVRVRGLDTSAVATYQLRVRAASEACGDGALAAGEVCDDGNGLEGDGCSADCRTLDTVQLAANSRVLVAGSVPALGTAQVALEVLSRGVLTAEVGAPTLGICNADSVLELFDGGGTLVGVDDDSGIAPCPRLSPQLVPALDLAPGRYILDLSGFQGAAIPAFQTQIGFAPPRCGDFAAGVDEECDDGNVADGDGCSSTCRFEAGSTIQPPGGTVTVPIGPSQVQAAIEVTAPNQSIRARFPVDFCATAHSLDLYDPSAQLLGRSDLGCVGIEPSGAAFARNLPVGRYVLRFAPRAGFSRPIVSTIHVDVLDAGCGNGVFEPERGEACDDGNADDGDICKADCEFSPALVTETEPNNSIAEPDEILTEAGAVRVGAMSSGDGDVDVYKISFTGSPRSLRAWTHTSVSELFSCEQPMDTVLELQDAAGQVLIGDDDDFEYCSRLDPLEYAEVVGLAAGTYHLLVWPYKGVGPFSYGLTVELR